MHRIIALALVAQGQNYTWLCHNLAFLLVYKMLNYDNRWYNRKDAQDAKHISVESLRPLHLCGEVLTIRHNLQRADQGRFPSAFFVDRQIDGAAGDAGGVLGIDIVIINLPQP